MPYTFHKQDSVGLKYKSSVLTKFGKTEHVKPISSPGNLLGFKSIIKHHSSNIKL